MKNLSLLQRLTLLTPNQISGYLVNTGWIEDGEIQEIATIWHRHLPEEHEYEILCPKTQSLKDYGSRVSDLISVLAEFESRALKDVISDISQFFADIIKGSCCSRRCRVRNDPTRRWCTSNSKCHGSIGVCDFVYTIKKAFFLRK